MNDKLKKALKIGAIALGVGAYSFLLFSVGACAARKGNETKADEIGLRSMSKAPKYAPNIQNDDNLLLREDIFYSVEGKVMNFWADQSYIRYESSGAYTTYASLNLLPKGTYYVYFSQDTYLSASSFIYTYDYDDGRELSFDVQHTSSATIEKTNFVVMGSSPVAVVSLLGPAYMFVSGQSVQGLYLSDTAKMAVEDVITLPPKWSPLPMFGGDIGYNGNILTNSEWATGYDETLTLWGFLFRNQGVTYNRLRIRLYWLGGSNGNTEVGFLDGNNNFVKGTAHQWCLREVEYALNPSDNINNRDGDTYRYVAGQVDIDFSDTRVTVKTGLKWNNNDANVLEILDRIFKDANGKRYSYGGITIGSNLSDIDFLKNYTELTSSEIGLITDNGNVFDLISRGFNAFLPILNIGIVPGITFGLLLFMPIMVAIIVIIIKVVKK